MPTKGDDEALSSMDGLQDFCLQDGDKQSDQDDVPGDKENNNFEENKDHTNNDEVSMDKMYTLELQAKRPSTSNTNQNINFDENRSQRSLESGSSIVFSSVGYANTGPDSTTNAHNTSANHTWNTPTPANASGHTMVKQIVIRSARHSAPDEKYPYDFYSFIALNGPEKNGLWPRKKKNFFLFGLVPFVFQILFLVLLLWSVMDRKRGTVGDTDNPDSETGFFAQFIPANTSPIVRCTQVVSIAAYVMFPSESLKDIVRAVQMFPRPSQLTPGDPVGCARFSCLLRGFQGFLATVAALLLVLISDTVVDIILNFTAVNFISKIDEEAFFLASSGEFGPGVQAEADRIAGTDLPPCMYKPKKHVYNLKVVGFMSLLLFGMLFFVIGGQISNQYWVTRILRVQFQDETGLREYSGCFELNNKPNSTSFSRRSYNSNSSIKGPRNSSFGYCREDRQWVLFKGQDSDPCDAAKNELELARSAKTDTFDISASFDENWVSATNTPLDMYFFEGVNEVEIGEHCDSVLGDGKCDPYLNQLGYDFDGGDCCASTCTGSDCGNRGLSRVFDQNITGTGFANCIDPHMVPITIHLNDIKSSRDPQFVDSDTLSFTISREKEWRAETPVSAYFALDCNGKNVMTAYIEGSMVNSSAEVVMVEDGANCILDVRNTTTNINVVTDVPIWLVDYTLFHGSKIGTGNESVEILSHQSYKEDIVAFRRIPDCYFRKLKHHTNTSSIYTHSGLSSNKAIDWLLKDESGNSECGDENFIERYALVTMNFAMNQKKQCTWPAVTCSGGQVDTINADNNKISSIPPEIGILTSLQTLSLSECMVLD
jgi:hypothetical protein